MAVPPLKEISACPSAAVILLAGKPSPKNGKAAIVLRELIIANGASVEARHLMRISGTDYPVNVIASLRAMGWVITSSTRLVKDRSGRRVQRTRYALDHANNRITTT